MHWLVYIFWMILTVTLQCTVAPHLAWWGHRPDWVLVLVVFYALRAEPMHAFIVGWTVGAFADLMTVERFGLLSLSYALAACLVCSVREHLFTRHPLTHFSVTLAAALILQIAWAGFRGIWGHPGESLAGMFLSASYTAMWAPPLYWLIHKALQAVGGSPAKRVEFSRD